MTDDFDFEPIPGLPERLPAGERILWQGGPTWLGLARRAFHVRKIALYCAVLLGWYAIAAVMDGASIAAAAIDTLEILPLAIAAVVIPLGLAYPFARSSIYTITNRRVVMRIGVALPITFNLPFTKIVGVGLRTDRRGEGDLPLELTRDDKIAWFLLWPHARPWRVVRPEPMLRAVPEAGKVAEILGKALTEAQAERPRAEPAAAGRSASLASAA